MIHYTTLEQSKRLYELGLDPNTADMYYTIFDNNSIPHLTIPPMKEENWKKLCPQVYTPCWSVGALIMATDKYRVESMEITPNFLGQVIVVPELIDDNGYTYTSDETFFRHLSPIDSLYQMIVYLLSNNKESKVLQIE